jgi:hypothetical protein
MSSDRRTTYRKLIERGIMGPPRTKRTGALGHQIVYYGPTVFLMEA